MPKLDPGQTLAGCNFYFGPILFCRPIREELFQNSSVDLIPLLVSLKEPFEAFDKVSQFFGQQRRIRYQRKIVSDLFDVFALLVQDEKLFPESF
jgi:hypothetical protein